MSEWDDRRPLPQVHGPVLPILKGVRPHNFIKPHEGLEGRTPAQVAGIGVNGKNKWLTLIQNASKKD